jgi:hypothetical protein
MHMQSGSLAVSRCCMRFVKTLRFCSSRVGVQGAGGAGAAPSCCRLGRGAAALCAAQDCCVNPLNPSRLVSARGSICTAAGLVVLAWLTTQSAALALLSAWRSI